MFRPIAVEGVRGNRRRIRFPRRKALQATTRRSGLVQPVSSWSSSQTDCKQRVLYVVGASPSWQGAPEFLIQH
jgi:hypothetical protein